MLVSAPTCRIRLAISYPCFPSLQIWSIIFVYFVRSFFPFFAHSHIHTMYCRGLFWNVNFISSFFASFSLHITRLLAAVIRTTIAVGAACAFGVGLGFTKGQKVRKYIASHSHPSFSIVLSLSYLLST
jgi:hypothetical protein